MPFQDSSTDRLRGPLPRALRRAGACAGPTSGAPRGCTPLSEAIGLLAEMGAAARTFDIGVAAMAGRTADGRCCTSRRLADDSARMTRALWLALATTADDAIEGTDALLRRVGPGMDAWADPGEPQALGRVEDLAAAVAEAAVCCDGARRRDRIGAALALSLDLYDLVDPDAR